MHSRQSAALYQPAPFCRDQRILWLRFVKQLFQILLHPVSPHVTFVKLALLTVLLSLSKTTIVRPVSGHSSADIQTPNNLLNPKPLGSFAQSFQSEKLSTNLRGTKFLEQVKPEKINLLDTDETAWMGWTTNTGKYDGWRLQTHPLLQRKVYGVCQVLRKHNDNWLFGPILELREAVLITIEITFTMRRCAEHPDPAALGHCHEALQISVFQADDIVADRFNYSSSRHLYTPLANLTLNDMEAFETVTHSPDVRPHDSLITTEETLKSTDSPSERVALYVNRLKPQGNFMALAVRDPGSCSTLRRVHMFHQFCRQFIHELVLFPRLMPTENPLNSWVQGRCLPGAMQQFTITLPKLSCQPDGRWAWKDSPYAFGENIFTGFSGLEQELWRSSCVCDIGFGIVGNDSSGNRSCQACGMNEYKNKIGRFPCSACPPNSHKVHSSESVSSGRSRSYHTSQPGGNRSNDWCECKLGFYRHPQMDTVDMPCTKLPTKPAQLQATTTDPARILLSWAGPRDTGGRRSIWFTVQCLDNSASDCAQQTTYINPAPTFLFRTLLIGLTLGKTYTVTVTSRNDLSELFPPVALEECSTSVTFSLPEEVPLTVSQLIIETITRKQFNASLASLGLQNVRKQQSDLNNQSSSQMMIRVSWNSPTSDSSSPSLMETGSAESVVQEYQVYVWMKSDNGPYDSNNINRPVLVHFLSETQLQFTDLPSQAKIRVWVRPRTSNGWGTFSEAVFHYSPSVNDDGSIVLTSEMKQTYSTSADDATSADSGAQPEHSFVKTIWLSLLLAAALILLISLLVFLKMRKRFPLPRNLSPNNTGKEKSGEPQPLIDKTGVIDESKVLNDLRFDDEPDFPDTDERRSENVPGDNNGTENASKKEPINVERRPSHTGWEFDPSQLKIDKTIGEGEFGEVCSGVLAGSRLVAIKMLRLDVPDKAKQDFLKEVHTTQRLQHPNIVVLLGVVTKCEPQMIVLEFMEKGSLDRYLQGSGQNTTVSGLMTMLLDICEGMKYISSQGYVHRDLAARNILVDSLNRCKISDFGLARKIGENSEDDDAYTLKGGKVPIRWTAPEAVIYRRFTIATDVWSFGIVAWELFSYGQRPYWEWANQAVISMLEKGYRLPCPSGCPKEVHQIMMSCWTTDAEKRPDFCAIHEILLQLMDSKTMDFVFDEARPLVTTGAAEQPRCSSVENQFPRTVNGPKMKPTTAMTSTTVTSAAVTEAIDSVVFTQEEPNVRSKIISLNQSLPDAHKQQPQQFYHHHQQQKQLQEQKQKQQNINSEWEKFTPVSRPVSNHRFNSNLEKAAADHVNSESIMLTSAPTRIETASPYYNVNRPYDSTYYTCSTASNGQQAPSPHAQFSPRQWLRAFPETPVLSNINLNLSELLSLRRIRF